MRGIIEALARVAGRFFTPPDTEEYPDVKPDLPARSRGRIILSRDPDGQERCVACNLCAVACPVDCIDLGKAEDEDGRWYPDYFRINFARCIFCGYCEEACPTYAIQLTPDFEISEWDRDGLVYEKEHLLIAGEGKYPGYRYWDVAGKAQETDAYKSGRAENQNAPVNLKGLRP